jgi:hypothetical protein
MMFIIDHGYIATDIEFKKILLSVSIKCLKKLCNLIIFQDSFVKMVFSDHNRTIGTVGQNHVDHQIHETSTFDLEN